MVKKVLIVIGVVVLFLIISAFVSIKSAQSGAPPQLRANFVDLEKIEKISRYRSCAGHVTVPQDERESQRNMKHYFWVKKEFQIPKTVEIYSPYDGYVTIIRTEPGLGLEGEIWISSQSIFGMLPPLGVWSFSVQHIDIRSDLKLGDQVKAGEMIGHAAFSGEDGDSFDIVYGKIGLPPKKIDGWTGPFADLDTVFNHLADGVWTEYIEKGVTPENILITKEDRDMTPCVYRGEGPYFEPSGRGPDDWVELL